MNRVTAGTGSDDSTRNGRCPDHQPDGACAVYRRTGAIVRGDRRRLVARGAIVPFTGALAEAE
jgi:hypothetical protein